MRESTDQVAAILEIARREDGRIPVGLLSAAYRASRSRPVALVLDRVSPSEVNAALDAVVARYGHDHCGVRYLTLRDEQKLFSAAATAAHVFAASDGFRSELASRGISFSDISEAEPLLFRNAS